MVRKYTKRAVIDAETRPHAFLSNSNAASIGRTIARHSYLEAMQASVIYKLLGVSIKQGRVVVKLPPPKLYAAAIKDLLAFHNLESTYDFRKLTTALEKADRARNTLAHSLYLQDKTPGKTLIQIIRGNWDELDQHTTPVSRAITPQTKALTKAFLVEQRRLVDAAIPPVLKTPSACLGSAPSIERNAARKPSSRSPPSSTRASIHAPTPALITSAVIATALSRALSSSMTIGVPSLKFRVISPGVSISERPARRRWYARALAAQWRA